MTVHTPCQLFLAPFLHSQEVSKKPPWSMTPHICHKGYHLYTLLIYIHLPYLLQRRIITTTQRQKNIRRRSHDILPSSTSSLSLPLSRYIDINVSFICQTLERHCKTYYAPFVILNMFVISPLKSGVVSIFSLLKLFNILSVVMESAKTPIYQKKPINKCDFAGDMMPSYSSYHQFFGFQQLIKFVRMRLLGFHYIHSEEHFSTILAFVSVIIENIQQHLVISDIL